MDEPDIEKVVEFIKGNSGEPGISTRKRSPWFPQEDKGGKRVPTAKRAMTS